MVSKMKVAMPTKEQIEYEESTKNFRIATAKIRLHQNGIESSKMSQQIIDKVMRLFDDMDHTKKDAQQKTSKIQQDAESAIQKVNQDANTKFVDIQNRYQDLINPLKEDKKDIVPENSAQVQTESPGVQTDTVKDEVREKTREEKVSEITDVLLKYMRDSVSKRVYEILTTIDKETIEIINNQYNGEQVNYPSLKAGACQ